jgi:4-hydroxy-tetrahydrodipicolinate reductase
MRIVISGYGKMGKEIEKSAIKKGYDIVAIVDNEQEWKEQMSEIKSSDAIIDFSQPEVVVDILLKSFEINIPIITGTTGWHDRLDHVIQKCNELNATLFYAPNFSIGVNIFFKLNRELASIMNKVNGYQVKIRETHHIHKLDSPSGTAIKAAEDIIAQFDTLNTWINEKTEIPQALPIISKRKGSVTGTHQVSYTSDVDKIELRHKALSRSAFAEGALYAAAFVNKKKGIFTMEDILNY